MVEQTVHRAFRYRLYPTPEQAAKLAQFAGATRFVYNLALEQRRDWWRQFFAATGRVLNFANQGREVTDLRREIEWIGSVPSCALTQALRDLDKAFANFRSGKTRYPNARKRGLNDSFRILFKETRLAHSTGRCAAIRVPNLGYVKLRYTRPIAGRPLSATFIKDALGWHVSIACELSDVVTEPLPAKVGIDRGVANTLALSTGELTSTTNTAALERRKRKAQRILARRVRGSNRYRKQRRRVARLAAKIARVRADWRHKVTTDIANRFGVVAIEDLNTKGMTAGGHGKRGLNRSILEQGWGCFEAVLAYKLEERGGTLVKVNPAYTSQTCSACGTIDKASRENQASFACRHCGFAAHADTNAAINILRRSTVGVEGCGCAPDEARTSHDRLAA